MATYLDLFSPTQHSVNDDIPKDPFSLQYISVNDAIKILMALGPGALMAKFDVGSAYRNVAMRPGERYSFGMRWRDLFFVDLALTFGLRSAPFIFNSIGDQLVEWILKVNYSVRYLLHYLDDFLSLGPAGSSACADRITIARSVFFRLGLPLHPSKCEGPTSVLIFLTPRQVNQHFGATLSVGIQEMVYAYRTGVVNWFPSSCHKGGSAWSHLSLPHDRPVVRLSVTVSPYSP